MTVPDQGRPDGSSTPPEVRAPTPGYAAPPVNPAYGQPPLPPAPAGMPAASWGAPPTATVRVVNPVLAILGALGVAVVGAVVWAALLDYANFTFSLIAVGIGSVVGALLSVSLGKNVLSGVLAAILTAIACLAGEVAGTYAYIVRKSGQPLHEVRQVISTGEILRHVGAIAYLFVVLGAVIAFLAGLGRRTSMTRRFR
jgi:hypothetical protein